MGLASSKKICSPYQIIGCNGCNGTMIPTDTKVPTVTTVGTYGGTYTLRRCSQTLHPPVDRDNEAVSQMVAPIGIPIQDHVISTSTLSDWPCTKIKSHGILFLQSPERVFLVCFGEDLASAI